MNILFWAGYAMMVLAWVAGSRRMNFRLVAALMVAGFMFWSIIVLAAL